MFYQQILNSGRLEGLWNEIYVNSQVPEAPKLCEILTAVQLISLFKPVLHVLVLASCYLQLQNLPCSFPRTQDEVHIHCSPCQRKTDTLSGPVTHLRRGQADLQ